jgi:hypothetical protein
VQDARKTLLNFLFHLLKTNVPLAKKALNLTVLSPENKIQCAQSLKDLLNLAIQEKDCQWFVIDVLAMWKEDGYENDPCYLAGLLEQSHQEGSVEVQDRILKSIPAQRWTQDTLHNAILLHIFAQRQESVKLILKAVPGGWDAKYLLSSLESAASIGDPEMLEIIGGSCDTWEDVDLKYARAAAASGGSADIIEKIIARSADKTVE